MPSFDESMRKNATITFLVGFIAGLVLWLGLRVVLQNYAHVPERAMWLAKARMINSYRLKDGDILIMGSSRAMAISPERLQKQFNVNAVNFSVGGATTPSTYFFLKRALNNNPGIRKVYLEFAPINMSSKDTGLDASLGENFLRYVATKEEAIELNTDLPGSLDMYSSIHTFPFAKYINMKDISLLESVLIRWRTGKSDDAVARQIIERKGCLLYPGIKISSESQNSAFEKKATEYYNRIDKYTEKLPSVTEVYFKKIIRLLNDRNVEYVLFFSPVPHAGMQYKHLAFGKTYDLFKTAMRNIKDRILICDNAYFSEPSHVNAEGSDLFSSYFYDCIISSQCNNYSTVSLFK
jgi:hypothetical protein